MKTMCSPSYHCNGFVETHAPWHKIIYMYMYIFKKSDISVKEISIFLSFSLII